GAPLEAAGRFACGDELAGGFAACEGCGDEFARASGADEMNWACGSSESSAAFNAASKLAPLPASGRAIRPRRKVVTRRVVGRAAVTTGGAAASSIALP